MATRIRLARTGRKKRPMYKVVVANSQAPRDGKFIEKLGTYEPLLANDHPNRVILKADRIKYWLGVGAKPSERVEKLMKAAGVL